MTREFTQEEAERHDALIAKGWAIARNRIFLHGGVMVGRPWLYTRWQLGRAAKYYEAALVINPEGWSSMWALGKIHQRMGNHETAYQWFSKAHSINPNQSDVTREASITAMDCGRIEESLTLCRKALAASPKDAGLICNLALAHCLAGNDSEAVDYAVDAVRRDRNDAISSRVLTLVRSVATGKKQRPKSLSDALSSS